MTIIHNNSWFTGSGDLISFEGLSTIITEYVKRGSQVFIGTDSFVAKSKVNFASAICLHGGELHTRYFFTREYVPIKFYKALVSRITEEVRRTIELADYVHSDLRIGLEQIEVHIDVSPFGKPTATAKFSEMLQGYVRGAGYNCKLKPEAWASQTVADKHSK